MGYRKWSRAALSWWLRAVAKPLEVDHYLLPAPRPPRQAPQGPQAQVHAQIQAPDAQLAQQEQSLLLATAAESSNQSSSSAATLEVAERSADSAAASPQQAITGEQAEEGESAERQPASRLLQQQAGVDCEAEDLRQGSLQLPGLAAMPEAEAGPSSQSLQQQTASDFDAAVSHVGTISRHSTHLGSGQSHDSRSQFRQIINSQSQLESQEALDGSQQADQPRIDVSQQSDRPQAFSRQERPGSSQHDSPQPAQQSDILHPVEQAGTSGPGTLTPAPELLEPASDGVSNQIVAASHGAGRQGQPPVELVQAAAQSNTDQAAATTDGLAANAQLEDNDELQSQLMLVGLLLMLTLLLLMTGTLTLPCIIGKQTLCKSCCVAYGHRFHALIARNHKT